MCGNEDAPVEVDEELCVENHDGLKMGRLSTNESPLSPDDSVAEKGRWARLCRDD